MMRKVSGIMRKNSGFTLVELMVAISLVSILVAIAVPSWGRWLPVYRLKQASRDVLSSFQMAKMEAVRRNVNVVISFDPDNNGTITNDNGEYILFVDDGAGGNAGNFVQDDPELLLGRFNMPTGITFVTGETSFSSGTLAAGFNSRGLPAVGRFGKARLSNTRSSRDVNVSITGNIRISRP